MIIHPHINHLYEGYHRKIWVGYPLSWPFLNQKLPCGNQASRHSSPHNLLCLQIQQWSLTQREPYWFHPATILFQEWNQLLHSPQPHPYQLYCNDLIKVSYLWQLGVGWPHEYAWSFTMLQSLMQLSIGTHTWPHPQRLWLKPIVINTMTVVMALYQCFRWGSTV